MSLTTQRDFRLVQDYDRLSEYRDRAISLRAEHLLTRSQTIWIPTPPAPGFTALTGSLWTIGLPDVYVNDFDTPLRVVKLI